MIQYLLILKYYIDIIKKEYNKFIINILKL